MWGEVSWAEQLGPDAGPGRVLVFALLVTGSHLSSDSEHTAWHAFQEGDFVCCQEDFHSGLTWRQPLGAIPNLSLLFLLPGPPEEETHAVSWSASQPRSWVWGWLLIDYFFLQRITASLQSLLVIGGLTRCLAKSFINSCGIYLSRAGESYK